MEKILKDICDLRSQRIAEKGLTFGRDIPAKRTVPLVKPELSSLLIAEIKRSSPSAGSIGVIADPVKMAETYIKNGAGMISVLTEEDRFSGSLDDLMAVKNAFPDAAVLRKDFIQHEDEVEISYRAGADAVLVITAMFKDTEEEFRQMEKIYRAALSFGMLPLVEIHNLQELEIALRLDPKLIGINARNLETFIIDKNYPLALIEEIQSRGARNVLFESGIESYYDAFVAGTSGFAGVLVGTSIVKSGDAGEKVAEIKCGLIEGSRRKNYFFRKLFYRRFFEKNLTVKICGLTNADDAKRAEKYGADVAGFVAATSPRKVSAAQIRDIVQTIDIPKAVVLTEPDEEIFDLARDGVIDAVQLHGDAFNEADYAEADFLWYRCVNIFSPDEYPKSSLSRIVLLDSKSAQKGGSGIRISPEVLQALKDDGVALYLAGGINDENAAEIVKSFKPVMIDISSGVEEMPGKKSEAKLKALFASLKDYRRTV